MTLNVFHFFAVLAAMAGYAVGDLAAQALVTSGYKVISVLITLISAISASFAYEFLIEAGSANRGTIVLLGTLISAAFFAMGALFPLTGVRLHLPLTGVRR
jgi:hypothetical protein